VIDSYAAAVANLTGDAGRGQKAFAKTCSVCHKLGGVGNDVGPDLASLNDKSTDYLLVAILDPNRAVEARYVSYVAEGAVVQADSLRARLCDLAESTGAAHRWARSLLDLAAADPAEGEESDARNRQLQAALDEAAEVPLEICETAADVVTLASWVADDGPEATRADAFAAACIAEAAVASAAALVEANLAVQATDDRAASARAHADASRAARRSLEARD